MIYTIVAKDKDDKVVAYFDFDCVRSFDLNMSANVSSTPVESAETITDNISYEPNTYSIEAIISSYGIFDATKEIVYDGQGLRQVSSNGQAKEGLKTHLTAREKLMQLFFSRQTVSLIESDRKPLVYNNPQEAYEMQKQGHFVESESCIITSLKISYPESADDAFYVSMSIQKVLLASVQVLEMSPDEMTQQVTPLLQTPSSVSTTTDTTDVSSSDMKSPSSPSSPSSTSTTVPSSQTSEVKKNAVRYTDPAFESQRKAYQSEYAAKAAANIASARSNNQQMYTARWTSAGWVVELVGN